ncbi:MAG: hypothetical protein ACKVI4_14320 [Actinomycetales bacterium]
MQAERRNKVRALLTGTADAGDPGSPAIVAGPWRLAEDDTVVHILEYLLRIPPYHLGEAWQQARRETARAVAALTTTCKQLRRVLVQTPKLYAELLARGVTDVQPLCTDDARPYVRQLAREQNSACQFRALRHTDGQMAFHCAGTCCGAARDAAERKIRKSALSDREPALHPLTSRGGDLAAAADVPACYVRTQRQRGAGAEMVRYIRLQDGGVAATHTLDTTLQDGNAPDVWCMAASHDGSMLAWTIPVHEGVAVFEHAAVTLRVWQPTTRSVVGVDVFDHGIVSDIDGPIPPVDVPAAVWWTPDNVLMVAWSTTEVHPIGTDEHDGVNVREDERYVVASYVLTEDGEFELDNWCGPYYGRLISISADRMGTRLVALVRQRARRKPETHYVARVHVHAGARDLTHSQVWKGDGKGGGPNGLDWGPSAAGISPSGDCIVVVHGTLGAVVAEVFSLDQFDRYGRVGARALTEWLRLDGDRPHTGDHAVKLRYRVGFSPCGRFATVHDQRARWGYNFTGYTSVTMDLSQRRSSWTRCACQPMGYTEYAASRTGWCRHGGPSTMRGLDWTAGGVWVLASRGALLVAP